MKRLLFIVYVVLCVQLVRAQSTEGTEFWMTFMNNWNAPVGDEGLVLKLIASSRQNATITVANPQTGYSNTFDVKANSVAEFTVPHEQGYTNGIISKSQRGLHVTATAPISLFASNFHEHTYDATIVLPVTALGTDYIAQMYESNYGAKEIAVVATQDNTTITIIPHARTMNGLSPGDTFTFPLNVGETYLMMSSEESGTFSGTRVQANHPVAVFAGHQCINIPADNKACDHIVEQQMPTPMWGKQFALTKTKGQKGDMVVVTARDNNTDLKINGTKVTTLQALQSYEFRLTDNSAFVEASGPSACYLYLEGAERNNYIGDPSSVHISPVEQHVRQITFATFQTSVSRTHYVNVVTTVAGAETMMLDGRNISGEFSVLTGNNAFRFAQINISHGTHTLRTNSDGFMGHVYGLGDCESYAYTMGSAIRQLDGKMLVDGEPRSDMVYDETRCYKVPVTFSPHANVDFNTIEWDFGDGQKSTQNTVSHTYATPGTYHVEMRIANDEGKDTARTVLTLIETLHDTVYATICEGEQFTLEGQTFTTEGKHEVKLSSVGGCDSIVTVYLTVAKTYVTNETANFRKGSSYHWHSRWFREGGVFRDTLRTIYGCDSIFILTLTEEEATIEMTDTICWQPTYSFRGYEYTLPPIDEYLDMEYVDYVLEYFDKDECEHYIIDLAVVPKESGAYELWAEIQGGETYDFFGETLSQAGVYTKTVEIACQCVQEYTLHLSVHSFPIDKSSAALCHEDSYTFGDKQYTEPGVYRDTVFSPAGIEEVHELTLIDNRSFTNIYEQNVPSYEFNGKTLTKSDTYTETFTNKAGCDSIVTLYLGINDKCTITEEINQSLCKGETIEWNGKTCTSGKDYIVTLLSADGCDSVVTLHLLEAQPATNQFSASICKGDYYKWNGQKYDTGGPHVQTLQTVHGCDSVVTLNLTVLDTYYTPLDESIVLGETFKWDGDEYTEEGVYTKDYIAKNGCDSVVTLNLTVITTIYNEDTKEICKGGYYEWNGEKLTEQKDYKHTYLRPGKADSVVTLHLIVHPTYDMAAENVTVKESELPYKWQGTDCYEEKTYTETLKTEKYLCDSVVHLNLKILPTIPKTIDTTICHGSFYEWKGGKLTESTDDTQTIPGSGPEVNDTIVTLHLTVLPEAKQGEETVYIFADKLPYTWHGQTLTEFKDYYDYTLKTEKYKCDSSAVLHLKETAKPIVEKESDKELCAGGSINWYGKECDHTGTFESGLIKGEDADTVYILHLTVWDPITPQDTTAYVCKGSTFRWHGVDYSVSDNPQHTYKSKVHPDCDSVVTLHIKEYPTYELTDVEGFACYGKEFEWNDKTYATSGTYTQHLKTVHGCDSTVTRKVTILPEAVSHEDKFLFTGDSYEWNGKKYDATGDYMYKTTNSRGCDSTAYLHLTVSDKPFKDSTETATKCAGETFTWYEHTVTAKESMSPYTHRIEGAETDTIIHLDLTVNPSYPNVEVDSTICAGNYILWNDLHCDEAKDYVANLKTAAGCDSIVTLHLKHYDEPKDEPTEAGTCKGTPYIWHGQEYTEGGEHKLTLKNKAGCDSVYATLNLTVYEPVETTDEEGFACYGKEFEWNDKTYATSGTYTQHLKTAHGCDSTVTRKVTIPTEPAVSHTPYTIFKGTDFTWNGQTYDATGDYEYHTTTDRGCDSTAYLHLTVSDKPFKDSTEYDTKCAGETFTWYEHTITAKEVMTSYTHRIEGAETDTIIHLDLTVNPSYPNVEVDSTICAGNYILWNDLHCDEAKDYVANLKTAAGCDSIVTLHLKHYDEPKDEPTEAGTCKGTPYIWHGEEYTEGGEHKLTLKNKAGCDSVYATLNLTVYEPVETTDEEGFACYGKEFEWNDKTYATSGTYTQHLKTVHGCDSTVTRKVTILPEAVGHENMFVFTGSSYEWNGQTYDATGDYMYKTTNSRGCDSTAYLHLTVSDKPVYDSTDVVTKCSGETFIWEGMTITPTETDYLFTARIPGEETDTVIHLTVTVLPSYPAKEQTEYICDGDYLDWNGQRYTTDGDYRFEGHTALGCDSIVTLHLKLYPKYDQVTDEQTIYTGDSYEWEGDTYTETTTVTKTLHTVHGCDSVVTLQLTVTDHKIEYRDDYADICEGETYLFYGETLTQPTEKTVTRQGDNTDTIVTLHLSVWSDFYREITDTVPEGQSYTLGDRTFEAPGDYTVTGTTVHGCDSTTVLHLTTNHVDILAIEAAEQCADDDMLEFKVDFTGVAHEVRVLFTGERAHAQGWRDTTVAIGEDGTVRLPYQGRAGRYSVSVELLFRGKKVANSDIEIIILYPSSVMEQVWNDVIAVLTHDYNGGYDFTAFQWYENGEPLSGETRSYLNRPLIIGGEYSALLTEKDGTQLMTCALIAEQQTEISLYPTVATPRQQIHCYISEPAEMTLYDAMGRQVMHVDLESGDNLFEAPVTAGMYTVLIRSRKADTTKTYKLIVQ